MVRECRRARCVAASLTPPSTDSYSAMAKFLSGPPGGRTLPQTATRLSDLVGGVYGPGASVASTGFNIQRPAIKAGFARAAGETWEDVVEYFLVRSHSHYTILCLSSFLTASSMPSVEKLTSRIVSARYITRGVFILPKVVFRQEARVSVRCHVTSHWPASTS
jgi:hypothetical protein